MDDAGGATSELLSALEIANISAAEAEGLVAAIWSLLEAHALATPIMDVRSSGYGRFKIRLVFASEEDRVLVETNLPTVRH